MDKNPHPGDAKNLKVFLKSIQMQKKAMWSVGLIGDKNSRTEFLQLPGRKFLRLLMTGDRPGINDKTV